ncbi:MAG: hypothetical protein CMC83_04430 [Flavobacteriaceae bacterium]|nr:hypothetical protein [Flavobacteriaceae bacterium]
MKCRYIFFLLILVLFQKSLICQTDINQYKYVSVSDRYDFMKIVDEHQISSLVTFLLKKNGFSIVEKNKNYPTDLALDPCLLLNLNIKKLKSLLQTKLELQFINCKGIIVFCSDIGVSREKDFKKSYHQAIRSAFESISDLNYYYTPKDMEDNVVNTQKSYSILTQPTTFGFNILDSNGIVLFSLQKTNHEGIYIIEDLPGIVYRNGSKWIREFVQGNTKIVEPLIR